MLSIMAANGYGSRVSAVPAAAGEALADGEATGDGTPMDGLGEGSLAATAGEALGAGDAADGAGVSVALADGTGDWHAASATISRPRVAVRKVLRARAASAGVAARPRTACRDDVLASRRGVTRAAVVGVALASVTGADWGSGLWGAGRVDRRGARAASRVKFRSVL
jgi:hypothetical protein